MVVIMVEEEDVILGGGYCGDGDGGWGAHEVPLTGSGVSWEVMVMEDAGMLGEGVERLLYDG